MNYMRSIKLISKGINGEITVPSSKSFAHRALIAASLCGRRIRIDNVIFSDDINATVDALRQLGVSFDIDGHTIYADGRNILKNSTVHINANESGSTLRFLIPLVVMLGNRAVFDGKGRLPQRPLDDYFEIFDENEIKYKRPDGSYLPLEVEGSFKKFVFNIKGNVSSQFITGLMFCGMINPVKINVTTELQSRPYIDITAEVLKKFGCTVKQCGNTYEIEKSKTDITEYYVENDWSQAAFFLCAGAINGSIKLNNMNNNSVQGDRRIVDILKQFGAYVSVDADCVKSKKSVMKGINIDAGDIPDLVPVLSVLACFADGTTRIYNAERLRLKESDRLKSMYDELTKLGADIELGNDYLLIKGGKPLQGTYVDSHNDHRVAMSMAVASVGCEGEVVLSGYNAVDKSYPSFFEDWSSLNE